MSGSKLASSLKMSWSLDIDFVGFEDLVGYFIITLKFYKDRLIFKLAKTHKVASLAKTTATKMVKERMA